MKTNIPPPERLGDLPSHARAQVKIAIDRVNLAIRSCMVEDIQPGLVINVLLSEAARMIACMQKKDREAALASLRANFDEMVEEYAEDITRRYRPDGR